MSDKVFFDTNILVYANDASEPEKQEIARRLIKEALLSESAVISVQVLSEFWVTVTRKIRKPLSSVRATRQIELLELMTIVSLDLPLFRDGLYLQERQQLSHWDSLIIAAARYADCSVLYSEDFNDGQKYGDVTVVNPFKKIPE